jgi:hypothetical protein
VLSTAGFEAAVLQQEALQQKRCLSQQLLMEEVLQIDQ